MKLRNKKGFTIVELVIVIAVVAILAAVLIPTFASLIQKANQSADIQAVRQMNTILATCVDAPSNIADTKIFLAENGIDANNYKPLTAGYEFFWDPSLNRIVMADSEENVHYPEDLREKTAKDKWISLSGNGNQTELAKLTKDAGSKDKFTFTGTTNYKGASINLKPTANSFTLGGENAESPATITNFVSDEGSRVATNEGIWAETNYFAGLIAEVKNGQTVTVENLVIDGAIIGDTTQPASAHTGIIAGNVAKGGKLIIKNVTIKNCVVFGEYMVGALVGNVDDGGIVEISNVTIENTVVRACAQGAALIGVITGNKSKVTYSNVTTANISLEMSDYNNYCNYSDVVDNYNNTGEKYIKCNNKYYCHLTEKYAWRIIDNVSKPATSENIVPQN